MKIETLQADHFRIPLPRVLSDATHTHISHFELVTIRVISDSGEEGLGYTYTVGAGGSAIHALIENDLKSVLVGAEPRRVEQLWEQMWWHVHYVGRGGIVVFALAAVDTALWDLKAKAAGEPLWRILGGHDPRVKAYAGGIDLFFELDALLEQTKAFLEQGLRAVKMKVGRPSLSEDVTRVAALRELIGADVPLMVDANMGWSVEQAIRAAKAFADYDVYWLEEPTIPDDFAGHARIAQEGGLPIAAGENLRNLYEFQHLISAGGVSFPEPDVSNIGGITPWMKVAHLAEANNLPVTSHGVHDLHVHLLAAVPNSSYLEIHGFGLEQFMDQPLQFDGGETVAPDRLGHGVTLDWPALERYRVNP